MIPAVDTNHVNEATGLLTSRFADKKVIKGLVTALALRQQEIENAFWAMIQAVNLANHPMAGGPWDVLDKIGAIVGVVRNGLDDADFLALIKLQAKVNRSRGLAEDVLSLAALMVGPTGVTPVYLDMPPAAFYLGTWNVLLNYPLFEPLLKQVRAAGTYGLFHYSTWPDGNDFEWGSRSDATAGQGMWGSRYDGTVGGVWVAAIPL